MPVKLGPAGVPLSCKGRTIVEGMDDIISLGLETMEVQTVRMVAPNHFEQYWQAGVLANKTEFEMNIHGPYYSELLGNRVERGRSLAKIESTLQAARTINARHITLHAGHYGGMSPGSAANEQVANVFAGVVDRVAEIWHDDEDEFPVFPWIKDGTPSKIGIETSGRQELWGSLEEVLEVVNHVEGTIPVLNIAHIHARGHGKMRTSEDYGELFDQVRETIGTKEFYCHFSGVEHRTGNAMHYTQIKKSDLNFEPLAEFIVEDGGWLDITLISDSPLLEHDAMYMLQSIEKSRHRQLERKARENRRRALAAQTGTTPAALAAKEAQQAALRPDAQPTAKPADTATEEKAAPEQEAAPEEAPAKEEKATKKETKKASKAKAKAEEKNDDVFDFEEEDDDLF
ncbi:TIM barrel protein [Candidatus Poseidoniaceae archaeon]|nr:TIM barrel protein [Candidatus Poseidoniaceae archaeon]